MALLFYNIFCLILIHVLFPICFYNELAVHLLLLHIQAANIEAEVSGINDSEFQLTKHDLSSLGRGKYSGMINRHYFWS